MRRSLIGLLVALAALAVAPASFAALRTATIVDARDGWTTAAGQPSTPDLTGVELTYDDVAGGLTVTADFAADANALATERAFAWSLRFALGRPSPLDATICVPAVQGQARIATTGGATIADRLAIAGTDGYLTFVPTYAYAPAVPGTRIALTAQSPALAGLDLRCIAASVGAREHAAEDDEAAVYDPVCDCWYTGVTDDTAPLGWFAGFGPGSPRTPATPKRPTTPRRASAIRVSVGREFCRIRLYLTSLTPGKAVGRTSTFGSLVVTASGPVRRTVSKRLRVLNPGHIMLEADIAPVPAGTYRLRAHYTGDEKRKPSPVVTKRITVRC